MHDYYVNSLGSYSPLSWVRYNSSIWCVISTTPIYVAHQDDPQKCSYYYFSNLYIYICPKLLPLSLSGLIQQTKNWWYFSYFPQKIGFGISCKFSPKETICMKCQFLFSCYVLPSMLSTMIQDFNDYGLPVLFIMIFFWNFFFFFFFLIWVLQPFQEYFTYIELIVHQRWAKTREPGEKPPDHSEAELGFPTYDLSEAQTTVVRSLMD